jgi:3'-5' exoribonuclease 1
MGHLLQQPYDFYLVMDLECTCEENDRNYPNEIIEFPVILVNARTLSKEAEFHRFVRPILNPQLSEFCTALTGITQGTVDNAEPFSIVLKQFDQWLAQNNLGSQDGASSYCFVTDGIWDMKKFIALELSKMDNGKSIDLVQRMKLAFSKWVDVRQLFSAFYGIRAMGIDNMLSKWNMNFAGRQHSGLDDTRNIATVALNLMSEGCLFYSTSTEDQAQTQEEIAMLNTIREIKKINKTLLCDKKQSPFASHNKYQVYQFRGTLQQVKSIVPTIRFASEPQNAAEQIVKVSIQTSKKSELQMRLCGLENVEQLEYEENPFQAQELLFEAPDTVVFKKAAFAGTLEQVKRSIATIKRSSGTLIIYFYVERNQQFLVNFPWSSSNAATSNSMISVASPANSPACEKKDPCWLDISCKHVVKTNENQSKLMLTVAKLLKLNPSLAPPSLSASGGHTIDMNQLSEEEWRVWRGRLIARKKELQQMKMKFKKDNPNNVVMAQKKPKSKSPPSSPALSHHNSGYNSPNMSPKHLSNYSSPVHSPRYFNAHRNHHHAHNQSPASPSKFNHYHHSPASPRAHTNRFCNENHQSSSLFVSGNNGNLMFSY